MQGGAAYHTHCSLSPNPQPRNAPHFVLHNFSAAEIQFAALPYTDESGSEGAVSKATDSARPAQIRRGHRRSPLQALVRQKNFAAVERRGSFDHYSTLLTRLPLIGSGEVRHGLRFKFSTTTAGRCFRGAARKRDRPPQPLKCDSVSERDSTLPLQEMVAVALRSRFRTTTALTSHADREPFAPSRYVIGMFRGPQLAGSARSLRGAVLGVASMNSRVENRSRLR